MPQWQMCSVVVLVGMAMTSCPVGMSRWCGWLLWQADYTGLLPTNPGRLWSSWQQWHRHGLLLISYDRSTHTVAILTQTDTSNIFIQTQTHSYSTHKPVNWIYFSTFFCNAFIDSNFDLITVSKLILTQHKCAQHGIFDRWSILLWPSDPAPCF